jgi:hypothetical protein
MIRVLLEVLWQRENSRVIAAKVRMTPGQTDRVRTRSSHKARRRRIAEGLLAIRSLKTPTTCCEGVDVRAVNVNSPVTAKLRPQIIYGDDKDIWSLLGLDI